MSYAIETVGLNHYYSKGTVQQVAAIQDINIQRLACRHYRSHRLGQKHADISFQRAFEA